METFWAEVAIHLRRGKKVFLAIVVEHTRHSPGTTGARLLVSESGDVMGTIGGGAMERDLLARARAALAGSESWAEIETLHHRPQGEGKLSGMICAGSQTNLYYLCRPEIDQSVVDQLATSCDRDHLVLEATRRGLTVREEPPQLDQPSRRLRRQGEDWSYEEELFERRRLAIFGAGHCALALARLARSLDYRIEVVEANKPPAEGLTSVAEVYSVDDFRSAAQRIQLPELTSAVVLTTDVDGDVRALEGVLRRPFPFVGVMGSPAKLAEIRRRLELVGFGEPDLARLEAPVGLAIGSRTPPEIAVSIAAQLIARRSGVA